MANHQQHTNFSTASGIIFGTLAWYPCGFPAVTCLLAGGLCGMGGMLPDIDIKTSRSYQDCMSITACIASMMVILRVSTTEGVTGEMLAIIGTMVFLAVKFGVGNLLKAFTNHRGLIHSIPFCILCGEMIFLIMEGDIPSRVLKAAGLSLGFFSHLLLDEIYSVDVIQGKLNTKKSFGTAIKFGMRKHLHLTIVLYIALCFATYISMTKPGLIGRAFDRVLDNVAALTIRGTQHFEAMSGHAQESLRNGTIISSHSLPPQPEETAPDAENKESEPTDNSSPRRYELPDMEPAIVMSLAETPITTPTAIASQAIPAVNFTLSPASTPGNPAISQAFPTRPPLVSERKQSPPDGRPLLLSELGVVKQ